jgi:hypothetical protein
MNYLAENALPIWAAGAVVLTMALIAYLQLRNTGAFLAIVVILAVFGALLLTEYLIVTPREAVERTLYDLADTVEANDVAGALTYIAPGASQIRNDVEHVMPLVVIDKANIIGTPQVEVDETTQPATATVQCRGFFHGTMKQNGMKGGDAAEMTIYFVQEGDRWLVSDYKPNKDWRREVRGRSRSSPSPSGRRPGRACLAV